MREIFLRVLPFSLINAIPPILHTHLYSNTIPLRRTSVRSLGTLKQRNALGYQETLDKNVVSSRKQNLLTESTNPLTATLLQSEG